MSRKHGLYRSAAALLLLGLLALILWQPAAQHPATAQQRTVRFAVIGDFGTGGSNPKAVAAMIKTWNVDLVITTGDNNYPDGAASTIDKNVGQFYSSYIYPYKGSYGTGATTNRFFPTIGNHDYHTTGAQPYIDYFTLPGNERYYDFTWGPVQFFALDSNPEQADGITSTSVQANWLKNRLAASSMPWKIVYLHHAPYSSDSLHGSVAAVQWPYQAWGASTVISGHSHDYERLVINGFPYFVNGAGGASLYSFKTPLAGSVVRYNASNGAMLVEATDTQITFKFYSLAGGSTPIDSYTITAGQLPTSTPTVRPTNTPATVPTSTPTPRPTNTPVAPPTSTPRPTNTPVTVPTSTAIPRPTNTPVTLPTATLAPSGSVYYVDCAAGNDANAGTSESSAWKTLAKASSAPLNPGNQLLLKRGCVWSGETLTLARSGQPGQEILVGAYGSGDLPTIKNQVSGKVDVSISGSYLILENLHASADAPAVDAGCQNNPVGNIVGFQFESGAHDNILRGALADKLYAGVFVKSGAHHQHILNNQFSNNIMMSKLNSGGNDDAGAFAVLLWGDDNEIAYNRISGSNACSYDYVRDGAAVEVYGGQRNTIHRNVAWDNDAFTELGNSRSADNTYAYNVFYSGLERSIFLVTRGSGSGFGPVANTRMINNTAYLTGAQSQGFVCHAGCSSAILYSRNNIFQSPYKAGYADAAFDEDYNLYWGGGIRQFTVGAHSKVVNPLFVAPSSADFHLQAGSPAVDAGAAVGYATDMEGNPVPVGAAPDMGAYEQVRVSSAPTNTPTAPPAVTPTKTATPKPTNTPTVAPTKTATPRPTNTPAVVPTSTATPKPTNTPAVVPTSTATPKPTNTPAVVPTSTATPRPSSTPAASPTPVPTRIPSDGTTTLRFTPEADARVEEAKPAQSFGTAEKLRADAGNEPDLESYLRFTVSGVSGNIVSARVRLYALTGTANGPSVYGTVNTWKESGTGGLVWNNRPARTTSATDNLGTIRSGAWFEIDVTPLVTGNGTYSFVLATDTTDGLAMSSREGTAPPQLVVVVGGGTAVAAAQAAPMIAAPAPVEPTLEPTLAPSATPAPTLEPTLEPTLDVTAVPAGTLQAVESDSDAVQKVGAWTAHATDPASGGAYLYSSGSLEDSLSLAFQGTQITVVYVKHPALGSFALEVDGVRLQTVSSTAAETAFGAQVAIGSLAPGAHTLRVIPLSGTIALDAFLVEPQVIAPVEATPAAPPAVEPTVEPPAEPAVEPTIAPTELPAEPPAPAALQTVESEDGAVLRAGSWTAHVSGAASGGSYLYSSGSLDDTLTLAFQGTQITVVYVKHPALGSFALEVDGVSAATVDSTEKGAVFGAQAVLTHLAPGAHTLRIVPLSGTIAIDAFLVEPQVLVPVEATPAAPPAVEPTVEPAVEPPALPVEPTLAPDVPAMPEATATPEPLPTLAPFPVTLPYADPLDGGAAWSPDGAWRPDALGVSGTSWLVDASQRGLNSSLTFNGLVMLSGALYPQITFWQRADLAAGDTFALDVSLDGGASWQTADAQLGPVSDWTARAVDLSAYSGQTIRLRFRLDTTGALPQGAASSGVWIDEVMIQDAPPPTPLPLPTEIPAPADVPPEATPLPAEVPPADAVPAATEAPAS